MKSDRGWGVAVGGGGVPHQLWTSVTVSHLVAPTKSPEGPSNLLMNTERSFPPRIKYLWMCVHLLRVHRAKCRLREYRAWQTRFYYLRDIFMNIYSSLCCVEWLSCLLRNRGLYKHNNDIDVWVGCEWSASLILLHHDHTTEKTTKWTHLPSCQTTAYLYCLHLNFWCWACFIL